MTHHKAKLFILIYTLIYILIVSSVGFVINNINFNSSTFYYTILSLFVTTALTLFFLLLVEIFSLFFDKQASSLTLLFTVFYFLAFITSRDAVFILYNIINVQRLDVVTTSMDVIHSICLSISMIFLLAHLTIDYHIKMNRNMKIYITIVLTVLTVLLVFKYSSIAGIIGYIVLISILGKEFFKNKIVPYNFPIISGIYYAIISILLMRFIDALLPIYRNGFANIIFSLIIIAYFIMVYVHFIRHKSTEADKKNEIEEKLHTLQSSILKEQIKPHFLFNALNVTQALYHQDIEKGDRAINLLSTHLRNYVEAGNTYLVSLEKELNNVNSYLELENLKVDKPFNIIYNIDIYDFNVPFFSIQPLVENAIRYSKVNNKKEGYIEISTWDDDNFYYIKVSDNGVGFDTSKIDLTKSYGIKNTTERFYLLLNAEVNISSRIDYGTSIDIKIPKLGKNDGHIDN